MIALDTAAEMDVLHGLLRDYIHFVTGEMERAFGVVIPAEEELERTIAHLDDLVPPRGRALMASQAGQPIGMVFLRPCGTDALELKRLYVTPAGRGSGAGRALVARALDMARDMGANAVYLDSTRNLTAAARLYESFGFEYTDAFPGSDHVAIGSPLTPYMTFMRKDLT